MEFCTGKLRWGLFTILVMALLVAVTRGQALGHHREVRRGVLQGLLKLKREQPDSRAANHVRMRISPDVTLAIGMNVLSPDDERVSQPVEMLASRHPGAGEMDAYERVLGDAMHGDPTLFAREDYVEEAWRIVEPILGNVTPIVEYEPNTWGPISADSRIMPEGGWHNPNVNAKSS